MPDYLASDPDEQRVRIQQRPVSSDPEKLQAPDTELPGSTSAVERAADERGQEVSQVHSPSLLDNPHLDKRGNAPMRIAVMTEMQQSYGNRAVQRFLQRSPAGPASESATESAATSLPVSVQRQWSDAEPSGAASTKTTPPKGGSWNKDPNFKIGSIRRIRIEGLSLGNQRNDTEAEALWDIDESDKSKTRKTHAKDFTNESAAGKAIVLVPDPLKAKEVDVLLYMHGFGIGYRQRSAPRITKGKPVDDMGTGTVRDVEVDHMEEQLEATIKDRGNPMVAVMPQGAYRSSKDETSFGNNFRSDSYMDEVFKKVGLDGVKRGRVVVGGHSGAGGTIAPMLGNMVNDKGEIKSEKEMDEEDEARKKKGKDPLSRVPVGLSEVVLFDAINGPNELRSVKTWLDAEIKKDVRALRGLPDDKQQTYLQNSMRFRGFFSANSDYETRYTNLKDHIKGTTNDELSAARKAKTDTLVLNAAREKDLRDNYENGIHEAGNEHEKIMGSGKVKEALDALPKSGAPSTTP